MKKPSSLAAALQPFDSRSPAPTSAADADTTRHIHQRRSKNERSSISVQAPSRIGKKALIAYFDPAVSKQLKQMALDRECAVQDLLAEALNDFFQKHQKPTIAA